jgi:hypothetical protein
MSMVLSTCEGCSGPRIRAWPAKTRAEGSKSMSPTRFAFCSSAVLFVLAACGSSDVSLGAQSQSQAEPGASDASADTANAVSGDPTACAQTGDCLLVSTTCCSDPSVAANRQHAGDFNQCHNPPPCPPPAQGDRVTSLRAFCISGTCTKVDIRADPVSACEIDDDCMLRFPGCCNCGHGQPDQAIAIAKTKESDYRALACSPNDACANCVTATFSGYRVACDATTKHCRAIALLPDGGDRPF